MVALLRPALMSQILLTLITGVAYPPRRDASSACSASRG